MTSRGSRQIDRVLRRALLFGLLLLTVSAFPKISATYAEIMERLGELFELKPQEHLEEIHYTGRYKTSELEVVCQDTTVIRTTLKVRLTNDHVENVVAFLNLTVWLQDTLPEYIDGWEEIIGIMKEMISAPYWIHTLERHGGNIRIELEHIPLVGNLFTYTID